MVFCPLQSVAVGGKEIATCQERNPEASSKALALICYRALTWYSLRLSPPRTHSEPWKAVGTRGRVSFAAW